MNQCYCIVVLLGLPASGKSWLAGRLCSFLTENNCIVNCATFDTIVSLEKQAEIAVSSSSEMTKHYRREMKDTVESFLKVPNPSSKKCVVIVDDNNYYRSMRYEYHQLAAKFYTGYLQIYVKCEVSEALLQNSSRPQSSRVPDIVITQMNTKFEDPCEAWENSLTIGHIDLNDTEILNKIWIHIQNAVDSPVSTLKTLEEKKLASEQSKLISNHNILHNIDKALRKRLNQCIRERKEEKNARVLAAQLNDTRQSILEGIKTGAIAIPTDILKADGSIDFSILEVWSISAFIQRCPS
ncbi:L-seryl-tRNA(Sec) kinase-like [Daphnia pulicaria]|jgi:O-phosphoseryl-tRNA(Sec) kinase|uniref:L-seryl-tRNA(Sec) kinase-like n=1 Tax=Daphnia pulicaria TaxID=35523 RepID=UPI001EEB46CF|nr:L-seryl-tRNA(Sec) kinase-like [Daphnia pulicaria]